MHFDAKTALRYIQHVTMYTYRYVQQRTPWPLLVHIYIYRSCNKEPLAPYHAHSMCNKVLMLLLNMHCGMGGYYTWHAKWSAQNPAGEGGTSAFAPPAKLLVSLMRAIAGGEGQGAFMSQPLATAITASLHFKLISTHRKHTRTVVTNI